LAVRMRLTRVGSTKNPVYRVVVVDSRARRDGRAIETIGQYNPRMEPSLIEIDEAKAKDWLAKGVQPSRTVKKLLAIKGIGK
jgi:small subunit ribosomal protein S16